jgi:hypothetical protein
MLSFGLLSFAAPWALAGAAALPLVWLVLRLTPPSVRRIEFPAVRLLFDLDPTKRTAAHTPLWLIILRVAILLLVLLGLSDPVLNLRQTDNTGPVIVVMDNGWAAATQWDKRVAVVRDILESADRRNQTAVVIATAPSSATAATPPQMLPAREVLAQLSQLAPQPWPTDRATAAQSLEALQNIGGAAATWVSDGVDGPGTSELTTALQRFKPVTVIEAGGAQSGILLYPPARAFGASGNDAANGATDRIRMTVARPATSTSPAVTFNVRALNAEGQMLARTTVEIDAAADTGEGVLAVPAELANGITRFDIEGLSTAATTALSDDRWQRRPVGIASATSEGIAAPLLQDAYYLREALTPFADVRSGTLDELLQQPLAVLLMAGGGRILDAEVERLNGWIDNGGLLVRFAGTRLDGNVDTLLPVRLRAGGGRTLGSTMSWSTPATLAPFPETSPFSGMLAPEDVTVSTQVLAEPAPDLAGKTWARLTDGTPLVTAERRGRGWVVLFHVAATPEWSNLPLSGVFVDMLRRMVDVSQGVPSDGGNETAGNLAPFALLDGFGQLSPPGPTATPIPGPAFSGATAAPATPPGLYGPPGATRALNLATQMQPPEALDTMAGAARLTLDGVARERAFKPWLLTAALVLLLADILLSFIMRRLTPRIPAFVKTGAAALLLCVGGITADARAAEAEVDAATRAAVLETRLAYIATGAADVDRVAALGLETLTKLLATRTAAVLAPPARIDLTASLNSDALVPYPVIYWRVTAAQANPPANALSALNDYLRHGGMVIFDAPEQTGAIGGGDTGGIRARLDSILAGMDIPPLTPLGDDHVLNRSFYLLRGLPGRYASGTVLVERDSSANDGVSSVIIGGNDWAAAWARDASGAALYAVVPGGEQQREMAMRAGVNLVMYALTGNYKADQVHLPAIMKRLTQ